MSYNPNAPGKKGTVFGLPFKETDAQIIIVPVPWDVTSSYHSGSSLGPEAILEASTQLDLELFGKNAPWKKGIYLCEIQESIKNRSKKLRKQAEPYFESLELGLNTGSFARVIEECNAGCETLVQEVRQTTQNYLDQEKKVGLLGGDHGTALGLMQALKSKYMNFGILHIDAHMDLRKSYEGLIHSHASIMYNALKIESVSTLVQVGIRDFCEEEKEFAEKNPKIHTYFNDDIQSKMFEGALWRELCDSMLENLPKKVYISFDIDGLEPSLCPGTGTPVPGGLSFDEAVYLLDCVRKSGREVVGFDLCEVAPRIGDNDWNANVGARILYQLISHL